MQISSKKRSLCIKYALHVFTASTVYSLSFPMLLAVITHYHLRPSMNKPRSFPTIHLYDLIYTRRLLYMPPRLLAFWGQNPAGAIIEDETEARLATSRSLCVATVLQRETKSRNKQREVQWLAHLPFTSVIRVRFLLGAVIRIKFQLGRI